MQRAIQAMIDQWFNIGKVIPKNPQTWNASQVLKQYFTTLQGQCIESEVIKAMKSRITRRVAKTIRDEKQEKKLLLDIENTFSISTTPTKKEKRVASSKLEGEIKKTKTIAEEYNKLKSMASGLRKKSETYVQKYGSLEPPPEIVLDPLLTDDGDEEEDLSLGFGSGEE